MMGPPPTGDWKLGPMSEQDEITVLRCNRAGCGRGLDHSLNPGKRCEYCGGLSWNNQVGWLTLMETIRLYRETGCLFHFEERWWHRPLGVIIRFLEAIHLTGGKNEQKASNDI